MIIKVDTWLHIILEITKFFLLSIIVLLSISIALYFSSFVPSLIKKLLKKLFGYDECNETMEQDIQNIYGPIIIKDGLLMVSDDYYKPYRLDNNKIDIISAMSCLFIIISSIIIVAHMLGIPMYQIFVYTGATISIVIGYIFKNFILNAGIYLIFKLGNYLKINEIYEYAGKICRVVYYSWFFTVIQEMNIDKTRVDDNTIIDIYNRINNNAYNKNYEEYDVKKNVINELQTENNLNEKIVNINDQFNKNIIEPNTKIVNQIMEKNDDKIITKPKYIVIRAKILENMFFVNSSTDIIRLTIKKINDCTNNLI